MSAILLDPPGVFQSVTQLCRLLYEKDEFCHLQCPTKSKGQKEKELKKLRSLAFETMLFKSRDCTSWDVDNNDEVDDVLDDPFDVVLGYAITRTINRQEDRAQKLLKQTNYLFKTGLAEIPLIKNILQLLLNLADDGPEENDQGTGFLNVGYSHEPEISIDGEVPAYRHYPREMFEGGHLLKTLIDGPRNVCGDPFIYITNPHPDHAVFKLPAQNPLFKGCIDDQNSFKYNFPSVMNFPYFDQLSGPENETADQASSEEFPSPVDSEDNPILTDEFWDLVQNVPNNKFRTWETRHDLVPGKEKPYLSEAPFSLIYEVKLAARAKEPIEEMKELKFDIVDSSELVRCVKFLLTGMESAFFHYDQSQQTFVIKEGICLEGLLPEGVASLCRDFIECGTCCRHLREFSTFGKDRGFVFQAFTLNIGKYLKSNDATVLSIDDSTSLLALLGDIQQMKMSLLYLCQLCRIGEMEAVPNGGLLLTYLCQNIARFSNQGLATLLLSSLQTCSNIYMRFLEHWLFDGSCEDPYHEFFIQHNTAYTSDRTRNYWKYAFVLNKSNAPFFLRDLECTILDIGKAVNLMRLVIPKDPLLYILQQENLQLPCLMRAEDIPRLKEEYEIYNKKVLSACGLPKSIKEHFQKDRDEEAAFLERIRQVRQQRLDALKAVRNARAQQEMIRKQVRLHEWEEQMKIVAARKEMEKRRQREIEAEVAEAMKLRQQEEDRLKEEAKQKIIKHYRDLEDIIEQRKQYAEREIVREQQRYVGSPDKAESIALSVQPIPDAYSGISLGSSAEAIATPNGNLQNNNTYLDNHPIDEPTLDNDLLNSTEDVRNRNIAALDISPTCDNILEATANYVNQALSEGKTTPQKKSTSDLDLSTWMGRNTKVSTPRATVKSTSEVNLAAPGRKQSWAWTPDTSNRETAFKIRQKMLREEHPVTSDLGGLWSSVSHVQKSKSNDLEMASPPSPSSVDDIIDEALRPNVDQFSRKASTLLIKEKHLGLDYFGIDYLKRPSDTEDINSTSKESVRKSHLKLKIPERDNRRQDSGIGTDRRRPRYHPPLFSNAMGSWVESDRSPLQTQFSQNKTVNSSDSTADSPEDGVKLSRSLSRDRKPTTPRVDYDREISVNSLDSGGLLTCRSSFVETPLLSSSFHSSGMNTACFDKFPFAEHGFFPDLTKTPSTGIFQLPQNKNIGTPSTCVFPSLFDEGVQKSIFESPVTNITDRLITLCDDQKKNEYLVDESGLTAVDVTSVTEVIKKSLMYPLETHMSIVHSNVMKMWLLHEDLFSHLHSLRNYYFLLDGEFGRSVTVALFERLGRVSTPRDLYNSDTLNTILTNALAVSTDRHNKNCERLSFIVYDTPTHFRHSSPNVLKDLNLSYKVNWPLNILITDEVLKKYSEVFAFLLKVWRTSWTLEDAFLRLKQLNKHQKIARCGHYQQLQLYRHMMSHIITAVHGYITSTVLQATWLDFQHELEAAMTIDHVYKAHVSYIKKILSRCLLHAEATVFQNHLDNLFTLVLRFHGQLLSGRWICNSNTRIYEHEKFTQLSEVFHQFQQMASYFTQVTHKLAVGYSSHLFELHQKLSMNDYYGQQSTK